MVAGGAAALNREPRPTLAVAGVLRLDSIVERRWRSSPRFWPGWLPSRREQRLASLSLEVGVQRIDMAREQCLGIREACVVEQRGEFLDNEVEDEACGQFAQFLVALALEVGTDATPSLGALLAVQPKV